MAETDYVTQREFDRVVRSLESSIRDGQNRVDGEIRRLTDAINTKVIAPPQETLSTAAAIHRGIEALTVAATTSAPRRGGWQGIALGSALPVLAWLAWKAFT